MGRPSEATYTTTGGRLSKPWACRSRPRLLDLRMLRRRGRLDVGVAGRNRAQRGLLLAEALRELVRDRRDRVADRRAAEAPPLLARPLGLELHGERGVVDLAALGRVHADAQRAAAGPGRLVRDRQAQPVLHV